MHTEVVQGGCRETSGLCHQTNWLGEKQSRNSAKGKMDREQWDIPKGLVSPTESVFLWEERAKPQAWWESALVLNCLQETLPDP